MSGKGERGRETSDGTREDASYGIAPGKRSLTSHLAGDPGEIDGSYAIAPGKQSLTGMLGRPSLRNSGAQGQPGARSGPPPAVQDAIATEAGAPLPDVAGWSRRIGADLSEARVVTGPKAADAAAAIGAPAFAVGNRVFLGEGVTPADEEIMHHELTHVAQQRGATVPAASDLKITSPDDRVEQEARGAQTGAQEGNPVAATGEAVIAPFGFLGRMGPGGGLGVPGPKNPQLDAFKYFEKHGRAHFKALLDMKLGEMTLETGSPYAAWDAGSSQVFLGKFAYELFIHVPARPWDLAEKTLVPASVWKIVDTGRDAENKDDPAKANEYHLGVTLEMQKAYRERLREAVARLMPRLIKEWNRRTVADRDAVREGGRALGPRRHRAAGARSGQPAPARVPGGLDRGAVPLDPARDPGVAAEREDRPGRPLRQAARREGDQASPRADEAPRQAADRPAGREGRGREAYEGAAAARDRRRRRAQPRPVRRGVRAGEGGEVGDRLDPQPREQPRHRRSRQRSTRRARRARREVPGRVERDLEEVEGRRQAGRRRRARAEGQDRRVETVLQ
jgi:hypothetical protein